MNHQVRWTLKKIAQRLNLIAPLAYRRRQALSPFRYQPLASPSVAPPLDQDVDEGGWQVIEPQTY
nr:hypothetical protein [Ktedonobacteraceae bacterium]